MNYFAASDRGECGGAYYRIGKDDFIPAKSNKFCGFIDRTGKIKIPFIYETVSHFDKSRAKVKLNGQEFFIDEKGNEIK